MSSRKYLSNIARTSSLAALCMTGMTMAAATNTDLRTKFPSPSGTTLLSAVRTVAAGETFDGEMLLWDRSPSTCNEQAEGGDDDAVLLVESGGIVSNVVIGPNNGEGIHCLGPCTLNNVWWTDVCEDAATFFQASGTSFVNGGGARGAEDKVLQHNGAGTVAVKNFFATDIGKLYRSCGNCDEMFARSSTFDNIHIDGGDVVSGVNGNFGDTTDINNSCILDSAICWLFEGNDAGEEPTKTASAPDGKTCATSGISTGGC